jgi:trehalose 6-phosphate synthase
MTQGRLVLVSNRGPYHLTASPRGLRRERTVGGLVTSLLPMMEQRGGVWLAWGEPAGRYAAPPQRPRFELVYVALAPDLVQGYYLGFSNNALWPMCHCFLGRVHYDPGEWRAYEQANQQFAQAALAEAGDGDVIWVHDYQLARVPLYVRQAKPAARLLFFWHIPFPPLEIFRTLPWRRDILEGLLSCDVVGFQIPEYARNFTSAAADLLGATVKGEQLQWGGRATRVIARPIGIDYAALDCEVRLPRIEAAAERLRSDLGDRTLILGVERMDYTKGIVERLRGVEYLLEHQPACQGQFNLIQIVTPSRVGVDAYRDKKREIDEAVGRINGRFSDGVWIPIHYLHRSYSPSELLAYYRAADIALVTPLRDGLNLVAKEYVTTRIHEDGVVILSEFAGAAYQLPQALITNPYSQEAVAAALAQALRMPKAEQRERMQAMRNRIRAEDIRWWADGFLECAEP